MNIYGIGGFIIGFIVGLGVNAYLLKGVRREQYIKNQNMRLIYGALNWGIALIGMVIGLALQDRF